MAKEFRVANMMHDIVVDELERHLSGGEGESLKGDSGKASRAFYAHLDACAGCRAEVARMEEVSAMIREMRFDAETMPEAGVGEGVVEGVVEPSLGFYYRVRGQIIEKQQKEAWGLFSPGALFFRRIAFASLLLLAGLGSFLVTRESSFSGTDAASIMAQHDVVADHSEASDRDNLLVTLATYRE